ncbi:MAG TPA: hypothetical protein VFN97_21435 [Actinospica sp.]|nr:hypothetical protein [Actinospica sp.]
MSFDVSSVRRAASVAAAGCTAVAAVALAGTPAHAQVRPASCTVVDIGQPGKIYVAGAYAGEVEQQYDNCHDVRSHFQWSSAFRSANPSAYVSLDADYGSGTAGSGGGYAYQAQDEYSSWAYIYTNGANTWRADAIVDGSACGTGDAYGDYHDYATGAEFGSPTNASC